MTYKDNKYILKKGKSLTKIIITITGSVLRDGAEIEKYKCFGSEIMMDINNSESNYIANGLVECAEISKHTIEALLNGTYNEIVLENEFIKVLNAIPILSGINEDLLRKISKSSKLQKYEDNEIIFNQDTYGNEFYIVHSGEVEIIIDGKYARTMIKDSYFGEKSFIQNEPRTATAISKGSSSLFVLTREVFESIIGNDTHNQIITRMHLQDDSIELEDLSIIKPIGKGMFGNVFLVIHKTTRILYALKTILFSEIKRLNIKKNIKKSENVLLQIESPLIMKLIKTLTDNERMYFVLEYIPGITLLKSTQRCRPNSSQIIFFISNIILMFKHLHSRNIVYRDLKPENIMIDSKGYLKLIDFDTASIVKDRCYTVAGTPHYMAPEMIRGDGYHLSVDYWSLGVLFYELLYDYLPFGQEYDDPLEVYHAILTDNIVYRSKFNMYQKILESLMERNPGHRTDYKKLMEDELFSSVQWDSIFLKKYIPSFIPKIIEETYDNLDNFNTNLIIKEEQERMHIQEL